MKVIWTIVVIVKKTTVKTVAVLSVMHALVAARADLEDIGID